MSGGRVTAVCTVASEEVVRDALRRQVLAESDVQLAVDEFWVPRSNERADLVVIGRSMDGFEIKTERDTLRRLPRQALAYGRVFDCCSVVIAEKHCYHATEVLPSWWGISTIFVSETITFVAVRCPQPNPAIDIETIVRLLWRDEVISALSRLGQEADQRSSRGALWEELLGAVSTEQLRNIVRQAMLDRDPARARIRTRRFSTQHVAAEAGR